MTPIRFSVVSVHYPITPLGNDQKGLGFPRTLYMLVFIFAMRMGRGLVGPTMQVGPTLCEQNATSICVDGKIVHCMPIPSLLQGVDTIRGRINNTLCATLLNCLLEQIKSHMPELCRCIAISESPHCWTSPRPWTAAFLAPRLGPWPPAGCSPGGCRPAGCWHAGMCM